MEREIGHDFRLAWQHFMINADNPFKQVGGENAVLPGIKELRIAGDHSFVAFDLPWHVDSQGIGGMFINGICTKEKNENCPQPWLDRFHKSYKRLGKSSETGATVLTADV